MMPTITLDPSPPTAGGKVTAITTDMSPGTIITFDWDPPPATTGQVDADGNCEVDVPDNGTSVSVYGGGATPVSSTVTPA